MKDNITTLFNEQFEKGKEDCVVCKKHRLYATPVEILDFILSEVVPMVRKETLAEVKEKLGVFSVNLSEH